MSSSEDPRDRDARAAHNQSTCRELNERLVKLNVASSLVVPSGGWICECAGDTCIEPIEMSIEEYEAVRERREHFLVASSDAHFRPDVERVIEHNERYWIVQKTDPAAARNPRDERRPARPPLPLRT